jgi:hypothetical protein
LENDHRWNTSYEQHPTRNDGQTGRDYTFDDDNKTATATATQQQQQQRNHDAHLREWVIIDDDDDEGE